MCALIHVYFAYKSCTNQFDNFSDFLENTNNNIWTG